MRWPIEARRYDFEGQEPGTEGTHLIRRGLFISLEGMDGTGKTTQIRLLADYLQAHRLPVSVGREPGGTRTGEEVRRVLLSSRKGRASKLAPLTELTLMYAARAQYLEEVVRPALARGRLMLSDRFNDASIAYQGYGRQLGPATVRALDRVICGRTQPDLTLVLDMTPRAALVRARGRESRRRSKRARFETQGLAFFTRVRAGYLAIARRDPRRVKVINADRPIEDVQKDIRRVVDAFLARRGRF